MKKFKMIAAAVLAGIMAVALAGCGGSDKGGSTEAKDKLAQVKEAGKITIGTEGTWAPWTFHDEDDNLVGFDVEVGKLIARELGVNLKQGYNGDLSARENGYVGGYMVKRLIEQAEKQMAGQQ